MFKIRNVLIIGLFFLVTGKSVNAQSTVNDTIVQFTGQLFCSADSTPLRYANVINIRSGQGTITDTLGYFYLTMRKSDILRFSILGYQTTYFTLKDSVIGEKYFYCSILVKPRIYELGEIDVYALRYEEFKYEFTKMEMPEEEEEEQDFVANLFTPSEWATIKATSRNPGISFHIKDKNERSRKKVQKLEKQNKTEKIIYTKLYSLAGRFTGFKGIDLYDFVQFCQMEDDFVLKSIEYDILLKMKICLEDYKIQQQR